MSTNTTRLPRRAACTAAPRHSCVLPEAARGAGTRLSRACQCLDSSRPASRSLTPLMGSRNGTMAAAVQGSTGHSMACTHPLAPCGTLPDTQGPTQPCRALPGKAMLGSPDSPHTSTTCPPRMPPRSISPSIPWHPCTRGLRGRPGTAGKRTSSPVRALSCRDRLGRSGIPCFSAQRGAWHALRHLPWAAGCRPPGAQRAGCP